MGWLRQYRHDLAFAAPVVKTAALAAVLVGITGLSSAASMDLGSAGVLTGTSAALATGLIAIAARRLVIPLRELDAARVILTRRASAMDHLLDFSETLQGMTSFDDVFEELSHRLWNELDLAGLAIVANDDPPQRTAQRAEWQLALCWPDTLEASEEQRKQGRLLDLPSDLDAHCIRLCIGRTRQYRIHLLLPTGMVWTDHRLQVAQTYVNTAHAILSTLHHLTEAERLSVTDSLTQLYNRRSMDEFLNREMALAQRHGHPLSIVMIDLDRFKDINDAHGHAAGDHLLQTFGECVRLTLRRTDLAFRYGGDEFCIALPNTPIAQAQQVVSKLRYVFSTADFADIIGPTETPPTLSIGVAERAANDRTMTVTDLLAAADQALYDAKHADRDCVRVYRESMSC
ncbi:MAG: GGDEF domain-containing protein [Phycisphaerae bacterium]|nr:GGDEF domain-containing protein [Phycisphaerae bacterium]